MLFLRAANLRVDISFMIFPLEKRRPVWDPRKSAHLQNVQDQPIDDDTRISNCCRVAGVASPASAQFAARKWQSATVLASARRWSVRPACSPVACLVDMALRDLHPR